MSEAPMDLDASLREIRRANEALESIADSLAKMAEPDATAALRKMLGTTQPFPFPRFDHAMTKSDKSDDKIPAEPRLSVTATELDAPTKVEVIRNIGGELPDGRSVAMCLRTIEGVSTVSFELIQPEPKGDMAP